MISANDVDQIKYDLENARAVYRGAALELSYTTVTAPISGRIGRALVTEGALVGQGDATQMALIQQTGRPTDAQIDEAMTNICRCGTYPRIRKAIRAATGQAAAAVKGAA